MPRARKNKNPVPVNMPGPAVNVPPAIEAELAAAYRAENGGDFLQEMIAERTAGNPEFPAMVEAAAARRAEAVEQIPAEWDQVRIDAVRARIRPWAFGAPVDHADLVALHDIIRAQVRELGLDAAVDVTHRERDGEVVAEIFPVGSNVAIMRQHFRVIVPEVAAPSDQPSTNP